MCHLLQPFFIYICFLNFYQDAFQCMNAVDEFLDSLFCLGSIGLLESVFQCQYLLTYCFFSQSTHTLDLHVSSKCLLPFHIFPPFVLPFVILHIFFYFPFHKFSLYLYLFYLYSFTVSNFNNYTFFYFQRQYLGFSFSILPGLFRFCLFFFMFLFPLSIALDILNNLYLVYDNCYIMSNSLHCGFY